jgi:hypothetical protein
MSPPQPSFARLRTAVVVTVLTAGGAGCTLTRTEAPPITGPSELALAIVVQATPDVLSQDGTSQATVAVAALDEYGRPVAALDLRADIMVQGVVQDFGRLSARSLTTASNGRASVFYTAPEPVPGSAGQTTVTIRITPLMGDARSHVPRAIDILLVPRPGP